MMKAMLFAYVTFICEKCGTSLGLCDDVSIMCRTCGTVQLFGVVDG